MPAKTTNVTSFAPAEPARETADADALPVDRMICIGLALLTLVVFKQTLGFGFVNFDDDVFVYANPEVSSGLTLHGVATAFAQGSHANWDPLTTISHMVDCQLFGLRAGGHHLTNVLLHTVSVVLLFVVLSRMTGARWPSAFAAALFAIHPLRVESVAWVTERKDVLSGVFFMLTLAAYVRYTRLPRGLSNYLLVMACFALGLMSKAMLVTLPLVLLLLDYWPLRRNAEPGGKEGRTSSWAILILEKIPLLALSAAAVVASMLAQSQVHAVQSLELFPLGLRISNALDSVVMYLAQMIFPAGLAVYYPYPAHGLPYWRTGIALLVIGGITTVAWRWRRERAYLLTGWLWYLLMLVPVIGLIQIGQQARADRYTYLPQIGLAVALSWFTGSKVSAGRGSRVFAAAVGMAIIGVLSVCTVRQTAFWRDSVPLWEHCLEVTPGGALAQYNYGLALVERGRQEEAVLQFRKALESQPNDAAARGNLGSALFQTGQIGEAITELKRAIELDPTNPSYHVNLGNALFREKQVEAAISEYDQALRLAPDYADAENTLGYVLLQTGRPDDALLHLRKAVRLDPENVGDRYTLATALLQKQRTDDAINELQMALNVQPDFAPAQTSLNDIAWRLATSPDAARRNGAQAVVLARGLVQLTRGAKPVFLRTLAAALAETGDYAEAVSVAGRALTPTEQAKDTGLSSQLREQIAGYRANQPFRDTNLLQTELPK